MYFIFGFLIFLCILFFFLFFWRRKRIRRRICDMTSWEKTRLLNDLIRPFGFFYDGCQDIFSSTVDAWQRELGYRSLFDRSAPHFNMVFDCEPVYFDYDGRTWMIEFWKGQYGINTGAEIGIYYADRILDPGEYPRARFQSVPDEEMLPLQMELRRRGAYLFSIQAPHWWLTGFRMGAFARPEELAMNCSVTFPNHCMLQSFVEGMLETGYERCELSICNLTVTFRFDRPRTRQPRAGRRLPAWWALQKNRLFCRIYRLMTRPFSCTQDKLLYLYYFLPAACRRMLRLRRLPKR